MHSNTDSDVSDRDMTVKVGEMADGAVNRTGYFHNALTSTSLGWGAQFEQNGLCDTFGGMISASVLVVPGIQA